MGKPRPRLVRPATVKRTVIPRRHPNAELRRREHLTEAEIKRLMEATKPQWGLRDASMVLVAYRYGLRAAELVDLRWDQVDFESAPCTSAGLEKALPARIRSWGTSCVLRRLQRDPAPGTRCNG
jgi:integrase